MFNSMNLESELDKMLIDDKANDSFLVKERNEELKAMYDSIMKA